VRTEGEGEVRCGTSESCSGVYKSGTELTLNATPAEYHPFAGWEGCESSTTTCNLTVTGPTTVTARFGERPTVRLSLTTVGNGSVTADGRPCSPSCEFP
jgi:hypothetical protein